MLLAVCRQGQPRARMVVRHGGILSNRHGSENRGHSEISPSSKKNHDGAFNVSIDRCTRPDRQAFSINGPVAQDVVHSELHEQLYERIPGVGDSVVPRVRRRRA